MLASTGIVGVDVQSVTSLTTVHPVNYTVTLISLF